MHTPIEFVPDYLLIGHIAHDVTPDGPRLGGTVSYGAHTAAAFGLRVGILTSTKPQELLLQQLPVNTVVVSVPAEHTTMFENQYQGSARTQYMYHRALTLTPDMLPPAWQQAKLVHFAPIAYEVAPAFVSAFDTARICVTPQGWMRKRAANGRVSTAEWEQAAEVLPHSTLTVMSEEDIQHNPALETEFAALAPTLIVTRAEHGGTLYQNGTATHFDAFPVAQAVDPTGAGDIFAATCHIALAELGDIHRALRVAAYVAGRSVTRSGFASAPSQDEVAHAWRIAGETTG